MIQYVWKQGYQIRIFSFVEERTERIEKCDMIFSLFMGEIDSSITEFK
jgi:hypothetical protein